VLRHSPDLLIFPAVRTSGETPRALAYHEARLIEECPCPLLLLKTGEVYSAGSVVAAVDPRHLHEKPRELDEVIVGAARTIAHALADTPVHLYHAVRTTPSAEAPAAPPALAERAAQRAAVESSLRQIASRHDIPEHCVHVESGRVEKLLPSFARSTRAQVVTMGAVSRDSAERALFGHTAEQVLDALECDLLIMKPEGFRSPVAAEPAPAVARPV
jgi:universal stress protein E